MVTTSSRGAHATALVLVAMLLFMAAEPVMSAVTCGQVAADILPCAVYARSGGALPPSCCAGVRRLNAAARTVPDKRQACACMKSFMAAAKGIKPGLVSGIPAKCGVRTPYRIGPSMDCSKVR